MESTQDKQRLEKAMAAIVKLERQLAATKAHLARLSGSYDLVRIADKDQTYDTIYYGEGSAEFDPTYASYLDQIAEQLNCAPKLSIRIEGHADVEESGGQQVALSRERSRRVRAYFISKGVRTRQMKWCGYGDRLQLFDPKTEAGKALNRRVEIWPLVQWFLEPDNLPDEMKHPFERYINPWMGAVLRRTATDIEIVEARGTRIKGSNGREYLDFACGCGAIPYGHNPPEIWKAIEEARDKALPQVIQPHMQMVAGELARRLIEIAPKGLTKVVFGNSGTEACEAAVKICRSKTGRPGVLSCWNAFHGLTLGSLSASGNAAYQKGYYAPVPSYDKVPFGDAQALEQVLAANPRRYAVFIVEPIQGPSGIKTAPPGYLAACREITKRHGVYLAFDEVATGLGRSGDLFACDHDGVVPDVLVISKALSGGQVPIGAALYTDELYNDNFAKTHATTFGMNAMACKVGIAAIDMALANDRAIVRNARDVGARLRERLLAIRDKYPKILLDVRGRGVMIGLKFTDDREVWGANRLMGACADYGQLVAMIMQWMHNVKGVRFWVALFSSDVMRVTPPLNVEWSDCERVLAAVEDVMKVVADGNIAALALESHGIQLPAGYSVPQDPPTPWACPPQEGDRRFSFLLHLADLDSYRDLDPSLAPLPDELVQKISENVRLDPTPVNFYETRVASATGAMAHGTFCAIPYTAEELKAMPREQSMSLIRKALDLGREEDIDIIGLGGYTSILSGSGLDLLDEKVNLTSGNAFTTVSSYEALCSAMDRLGRSLDQTVAVVGATGSIGSAISMLLGEVAGDLILVGNPNRDPESCRRALLEVGAKVCRHVGLAFQAGEIARPGAFARRFADLDCPSADAPVEDWLPLAERVCRITQDIGAALEETEVVVTATNHPGAVVPIERLRSGTVICDVAVPANVSKDVKSLRPDVLVIDGGVVAVPGPCRLIGAKLDPGMVYACIAETMLLCLDGRTTEGTVGPNVTIEKMNLMRELARKHGFRLAKLRSFGSPLSEEDWDRFRRLAEPAPTA